VAGSEYRFAMHADSRRVTPFLNPVFGRLGNTTAVAKGHYIDIPETVPDNRDVLERWAPRPKR
jgi:hypothetical protein